MEQENFSVVKTDSKRDQLQLHSLSKAGTTHTSLRTEEGGAWLTAQVVK